MDNRAKNSSVMESFWTIRGTHLGQTRFQNIVSRGSGFCGGVRDSGGEGASGAGSSAFSTKCLDGALCAGDAPRAPLLGEERCFVFIGCLECVEGRGHLLN